jgi:ribosomal protein S18 acetylase RimI-like enzyme
VDAALGLIAHYWPDAEPITHHAAARAVVLTAADQAEELGGAVVGQILPGKVAFITPPRIRVPDPGGELARRLLLQLDSELHAAGVGLAQTLLAPDDAAAASILRVAGYEHAADLLYMAAESDSFPDSPPPLPVELFPWQAEDKSKVAELIEQTYVGTLDCPRIDGLRKTTDVLAGYRTVGDSGDSLWHIVRAGNQTVGCLLLADHAATLQWEIVYVGLVPAARGHGWGLELTRHAQWLARQAGRERLVLAVDAANEPAIRIYSIAGFRAWDRRAVWIKPLTGGPTGLQPTT